LNKKEVTEDGLAEQLVALQAEAPGTAVIVRAHRDLPVQRFITVMDAIAQAGITKVGVMTRPLEE
jgi:biopolymer transport protein ExbD